MQELTLPPAPTLFAIAAQQGKVKFPGQLMAALSWIARTKILFVLPQDLRVIRDLSSPHADSLASIEWVPPSYDLLWSTFGGDAPTSIDLVHRLAACFGIRSGQLATLTRQSLFPSDTTPRGLVRKVCRHLLPSGWQGGGYAHASVV